MLLQLLPCATVLQQMLSQSAETEESNVKSWSTARGRSKAKYMMRFARIADGISPGPCMCVACSGVVCRIEEDMKKQSENSWRFSASTSGLCNEAFPCLDLPALQALRPFSLVAFWCSVLLCS